MSANGNHLKLYKFHLALLFVTFIVYLILFWSLGDYLTESGPKAGLVVLILPSIMHFILAFGCKYQQNWARELSVFVGAPMLLFFPIGTIVGFYYMPLTQWENIE